MNIEKRKPTKKVTEDARRFNIYQFEIFKIEKLIDHNSTRKEMKKNLLDDVCVNVCLNEENKWCLVEEFKKNKSDNQPIATRTIKGLGRKGKLIPLAIRKILLEKKKLINIDTVLPRLKNVLSR